MANERLRSSITGARLTITEVAAQVGVDPKTVERWIVLGRIPHRSHRWATAALLGTDEAYLFAGRAGSSWAFILQPVGQDSTRLLVRCRGNSLMARLQGPVQFVMQRKMMLGIKQRAERNWLTPSRSDAELPRPRLLAERRDLVLTDPARPLERRTGDRHDGSTRLEPTRS